MKKCSKCRIEKSESDFSKNQARLDGLDHYCKSCRQELKSLPHWREKALAYDKTPLAAARHRRYQRSEKGKLSEKRKRDRYRKTEKGRRANNAAKLRSYYRDPRYHVLKGLSRLYGSPIGLLKEVWDRDKVCQMCGSTESLQFDHIHPRRFGGVASSENLQLLCGTCNNFKHDNLLLPGGGVLIVGRKTQC